MPWFAAGSIGAGLSTLILIKLLYKYRGKPGAGWLLGLSAVQAVFCLSYGISLFVFDPALRLAFEVLTWIGIVWTGPLFLAFALEYTGRGTVVRSIQFAPIAAVTVLTTGLLLSTPYHTLLWSEFQFVPTFGAATVQYTFEPLAYLTVLTVLITAGIGVLLLVETILSYGPLYRREATAVALSTLFPALGLVVWAFELGPMPQVNLTPILFVPHVLLDGYAFVGTNMFDSNPTTRRAAEQTAINDLDMPIVILDTDALVVDLNRAAQRLFETEKSTALRKPISDLSGRDRQQLSAGQVVTLSNGGQRLDFMLACSPLKDPRGRQVGETVVFQDITRERQQKQRLEVLNRVIRHNLRNEMTVIQGYAQTIKESPDSPHVPAWAATINDGSDRLTDIGEKARDFEQIIDTERSPTERSIQTLLDEVQSTLSTKYSAATIEHRIEPAEDVQIYTDPDLFTLVVTNLVESTLKHNSAATPEVTVTVRTPSSDNETIEITVQDNSPGIPESELVPLRNGAETTLEHGSGIGLWITAWGTSALGGELSFTTGSNGTTASISLPQQNRRHTWPESPTKTEAQPAQ